MKFRICVLGSMLLSVFIVTAAQGATATVSLDRWMYPFAFTGGTRDLAPTFGAVGTPGFDNRDAQFLIGFDTSSTVPVGQGAANYQINSVTVRAMVGSPAGFEYDPTYDRIAPICRPLTLSFKAMPMPVGRSSCMASDFETATHSSPLAPTTVSPRDSKRARRLARQVSARAALLHSDLSRPGLDRTFPTT